MNERERILDLVKKGVLSTDEALDLLESIAKAKDASQIQKVADAVQAENREKEIEKNEQAEKSLEENLEDLTNESQRIANENEEIAIEIQGVKEQISEVEEAIMQFHTKEELGLLSDDDRLERMTLENERKSLLEELDSLEEEKKASEEVLQSIKRQQYQKMKEKVVEKFDIPEDWREQANEKLTYVSDKFMSSGTKVGDLVKKTVQSVTELINENVEWKNLNVKVPGVASTKFEKDYHFEPTQATIIDIKVANGKVSIEQALDDSVSIKSSVKLYGKFASESPEEVFAERSDISVTEDKISIQIPNKRIYTDLVIFLPRRIYDYTSIKMLNGSISLNDMEGKDFYVKTTNGNVLAKNISATMFEVEGVNGDITIEEGLIRDTVIESINGDIQLKTTPETVNISLVNGDIKLSFSKDTLKSVKAHSVNGDVKLAVPKSIGLSGSAKTNLGSIKQRLSAIEITREKKEKMNQYLQFERVSEEIATLDLETATGNIYLKDLEE